MADQNPSAMSDEELDKAIEEAGIDPAPAPQVEEPETPETPPEEVVETPEEEPEEEEVPETPPPETKPEPKEPSRREQRRVSDLLKKYPELAEEPPAKPANQQPADLFDFDKDLEADEGLKERLKADREAAVKAAREQGVAEGQSSFAQERNSILFHTRLDIDAPRIESKYPILDKDSDKFNPQLATDVNSLFLQAAQYNSKTGAVGNPSVRYGDFVEAFFTAAREAAGEMAEETTKNVRKRAATTGLRPDGSAPAKKLNLNKLPHQMTDEELDAAIAQGLPSN